MRPRVTPGWVFEPRRDDEYHGWQIRHLCSHVIYANRASEEHRSGASASWPPNERCHQCTARHLWNLCGRRDLNTPRTTAPNCGLPRTSARRSSIRATRRSSMQGRHLCEPRQVNSIGSGHPQAGPERMVSSMDGRSSMESMREATSKRSSNGGPGLRAPRTSAGRPSSGQQGRHLCVVSSMRTGRPPAFVGCVTKAITITR